MRIVAGIDEAGYSPVLGPLVVGCSAFEAPSADCDLWEVLSETVRRSRGGRGDGRLVVDDSKRVHSGPGGLAKLERTVAPFIGRVSGASLSCEDDVLDAVTGGRDPRSARPPWYDGGLAEPLRVPAGDIAGGASQLAGVPASMLSARAVGAAEYNEGIRRLDNKADLLWEVVAAYLCEIWNRWASDDASSPPFVVVDRLGGRMRYAGRLQEAFGDCMVWALEESADVSRYTVESPAGRMEVAFVVKADSKHLPVALAGMTAKYVRELFVGRLNRFFAGLVPGIEPTSGYHSDAGGFLESTAAARAELGVDDDLLIRSR